MSLRIRQIVFAARDLASATAQFEKTLGLQVAYRDPLVAEFGLHNALLTVSDQFIEIVSPTRDNTAAGRHLERHGDSAYMLIFQTDDIARDRARLERLKVRTVWQADHPDIRATQLHPKDIGAAIVSLDQPTPPAAWRWAGPNWERHSARSGARVVLDATIGARDPSVMAQRWSEALGIPAPIDNRIVIENGALNFSKADADVIVGYTLGVNKTIATANREVTLCGTKFRLIPQ